MNQKHELPAVHKSPAFQFYVQDFVAGTMDFNATQIGAYLLLLCRQWDKGELPNDPERLVIIGRCSIEVINVVIEKFEVGEDGKLRNVRLEKIRAQQIENRGKKSKAGKLGNDERWKDKKEVKPNYIDPSKSTLPKITLEHLDNTQKLESLAKRYDVSFERIQDLLTDFKSRRENDERDYPTVADLRSHFDNFCGSKIKTKGATKKEREKCPYTDDQLRLADAQKAGGMGTPEWFDKKWLHLLNN